VEHGVKIGAVGLDFEGWCLRSVVSKIARHRAGSANPEPGSWRPSASLFCFRRPNSCHAVPQTRRDATASTSFANPAVTIASALRHLRWNLRPRVWWPFIGANSSGVAVATWLLSQGSLLTESLRLGWRTLFDHTSIHVKPLARQCAYM
jgi:hypothetical protein